MRRAGVVTIRLAVCLLFPAHEVCAHAPIRLFRVFTRQLSLCTRSGKQLQLAAQLVRTARINLRAAFLVSLRGAALDLAAPAEITCNSLHGIWDVPSPLARPVDTGSPRSAHSDGKLHVDNIGLWTIRSVRYILMMRANPRTYPRVNLLLRPRRWKRRPLQMSICVGAVFLREHSIAGRRYSPATLGTTELLV